MGKNTRLFKLYKYLADRSEPVSLQELAAKLEVSKRTIRYDLAEIADLIADYKLSLIRKPNYGILLQGTDLELGQALAEFDQFYQRRHFQTADQRKYLILYKLFQKKDPLIINELTSLLDVSAVTVSKDLDLVAEWLKYHGLELIRRRNYGIKIQGAELKIRQAMKALFNETYERDDMLDYLNQVNSKSAYQVELKSSYSSNLQELLQEIDLTKIELAVKNFAEQEIIKFTETAFSNLVLHLAFAILRLRAGQEIKFAPKRLKLLAKQPEYQLAVKIAHTLAEEFKLQLPGEEIAFITLHLLGARRNSTGNTANLRPANLPNLIREMIRVVEKYFAVKLINDQKLVTGLTIHLQATIKRIIFDLPIENPLLTDIKNKYKAVFAAAQLAVKLIQNELYVEISEDETAYLALHFGAALERLGYHKQRQVKVILVCSSGVGTTNLLEVRLKNEFKRIKIVASVASFELSKQLELFTEVDFIITTIPLGRLAKDCVLVNPLLNEEDIEKIKKYLQNHQLSYGIFSEESSEQIKSDLIKQQPDRIVELLKPYLKPDTVPAAQKKLEQYFNYHVQLNDPSPLGLLAFLKAGHLKISSQKLSWQEALTQAGELLKQKDLITENYIKRMIAIVKENGPYIALAPQICLAHARIDDGVKQAGISLLILKNGTKLGHDFDPINFVFVLAPVDKKQHLPALTDIITLANCPELLTNILKQKNEADVLALLKNSL
ncbi:BglG family transcription antiterminator [Halanaerobium salsuginis]|nr:BglG family transcription antiterminator [Halanaerobium salsuginis]